MFSKFFIDRPIFATVLALLMVFAGGILLFTLPIAQYPDMSPPTIMVMASYPGADAKTVANAVGVPIEQAVNGVEGMLYMQSNSGSDGSYNLTITFESGTDVDEAAINVQNMISESEATLPSSVKEQGISVVKRQSDMLLFISLQSDRPELYDALYLTNYAQLNLLDPLSRVKGVGNAEAFGGGEYSMRVWLDPLTMRARNLSTSDVLSAIASQNIQVSGGSIGAQPSTGGEAFEFSVVSEGQLADASQFGNIVIRTDDTGILRLKDVAKVELGSNSYSQTSKVNNRQAAMIGISQLPGANAIETADGVKDEMKKLSSYFPEGIHYDVVLDTTTYVHKSIDEVVVTFVETAFIVMLVILIFLQNWRAVIIPMITIPVSLIGTFIVMKLLGFSLNILTLFGLVLAIALVVDDAIVVVEDCSRLVDEGRLTRKQAAEKAMNELTGPVVGEVLVLLSVFIPTAFVSGITGALYKQFALTIATATAISGFNALTLTPALCALFLNPRKPSRFFLYVWFNKVFGQVLKIYNSTVAKMLGHMKLSLLLFLGICGIAFFLFAKWPSSYIPQEDEGYFMTSIQLPDGASLDRTEAVVDKLTEGIMKIDGVKDVMAVNGMSFMAGGSGSNLASLFVILKPWNQRPGINEIIAEAEKTGSQFQEAIIFSLNPPAIPGLGTTSGLSMQLLDINNLGTAEMQKAVTALQEAGNKDPRIGRITSMFQGMVPQLNLKVDRDKIALMGLDIDDVYSTLSNYLGSTFVNDFTKFGRVFQVTMAAEGNERAKASQILSLSLPNADGEMVPFSAFATIEETMGAPTVSRYNMYDTAGITATAASGVSSNDAIQAMDDLVKETLGSNFSYAWTGEAYQETQSGTTITVVFIFAIVLTLLVLAAQYESWTDPIAVVLGLPIAVLGCVLGCICMRQSISIYTQIGLIMLLGLSAKNAILIVEYAMDFRKTGASIDKSAQDAGNLRFRPIMMTALAFVFGVMPMMFATGAGANSRIALGTAIVFGMAVNAVLGTLFVPSLWKLMQGINEKYLSNLFPDNTPVAKDKTGNDGEESGI